MPAQRCEVRRRGRTTGIRSDVVLELLAVKQKHVPPGPAKLRCRSGFLSGRQHSAARQPNGALRHALEESSSLHID
jgi:hypothetical protein